jgi:predicted DNA-binding protein
VNVRLPPDLAREVRNASARLGVQPNVVVRACVHKYLDLREDEALAESSPEIARVLRNQRASEKARKALSA